MAQVEIPYYETSYFVFSNFSPHSVEIDGVVYPTVEHAFHAQKFDDEALRERFRTCGSPLAAWELARERKSQRRADWGEVKVEVLTDIIRAKIRQHKEVQDALLATGAEEIVELNPQDEFWGSGATGHGQNQTGKILMKLRDELRRGEL